MLKLMSGAAVAALACRRVSAAEPWMTAEMEGRIGKVKIRDVQVAAIQDEYVCHLVKITTDAGVFGLGEARPKATKVPMLIRKYGKELIGDDPLKIHHLVQKLIKAGCKDMGVISGIETALWDLAGRLLDTPTYKLLGETHRDKVMVYYDLAPADTPKTTRLEEWVACTLPAVKAGFRALKVDVYRGGGDVPEWIEIMKAIRKAVGADIQIGVDFHWRLTPEQTDKFIQGVEPAKLWFIEDPMNYEKHTGHYQRIVREGRIPVVGLEQITKNEEFAEWAKKRICTVVQPDGQYIGGLIELKRAADIGQAHGMKTLCHNMCTPVGTYAQAHACATMKDFVAIENACAVNVIKHNGSLYENGCLVLHDKPGYGIELDEEYCRKHLAKGSTFFGE